MKLDPRFVSLQRWEINYLMKKFDFWEAHKGYLSFQEVKDRIIKAKKECGKSRRRIYQWLRVRYSEK